jgi:ferredoxin-NADP reductase
VKVAVYADFNCVYCFLASQRADRLTRETRAFSMASPPSESGSIDLVVRVLPGGAFSAALDERLAPGDRFRLSTGPSS